MTRLTDGQEPILRQTTSDGTIEILNRDECADRFECSIQALDGLVADHNALVAQVGALRAERDALDESLHKLTLDFSTALRANTVAVARAEEAEAALAQHDEDARQYLGIIETRCSDLEARIAAAEVLHVDYDQAPGNCRCCGEPFPCSTRRALSGEGA